MAIHSSHLPAYRHIYRGINQTPHTAPRSRLAAASSAGSTTSCASSSIATTGQQPELMSSPALVGTVALGLSTRTMRGTRGSETRRMDTATTSRSWEDTPSIPARPTTAVDSAQCPPRMWATTKMLSEADDPAETRELQRLPLRRRGTLSMTMRSQA